MTTQTACADPSSNLFGSGSGRTSRTETRNETVWNLVERAMREAVETAPDVAAHFYRETANDRVGPKQDAVRQFKQWFERRTDTESLALGGTDAANPEETRTYIAALHCELHSLQGLPADWDGHGAARISVQSCRDAAWFIDEFAGELRGLEVYPEPDGSVGAEWHDGTARSLYLSFSGECEVAYVAVLRGSNAKEQVHRGSAVKLPKGMQAIRTLLDADS